jgi:hypothetical protein
MSRPHYSTQPQPFADRDWELEAVDYRLRILRSGGSVFQCVVNFYGIPGIGKTRLLKEIQSRAQGIPTAMTDLAAFRDGHRAGPEVLADQMVQLEQQTRLSDAGFQKALKAFRAHPLPEDPYDEAAWYRFRQKAKEVADAFSVYVYRHVKQPRQPVLLLFDNSEAATGETFDWLEYEVFSPLVQTDRIMLVVAGLSPVRWKRFEVRRRVLLRKLNPPQDDKLLEKQAVSWEKIADNIFRITFNYPPANRFVAEELERLGLPLTMDTNTFDDHRPALIQRLMTEVVEQNLLAGVDDDIRLAWRIAAPLRQFDVTILRRVLPEFEPNFEGRGGNYYLLMLNRMVDTALVEWSAERKAYVLDDTLRQFLALALETRDPDLARRIHERATELYRQWLEDVPENRSAYLVEWLYHEAQVLRLKGQELPAIAANLRRALQPVLEQFYQPITVEDDRLVDGARQLVEQLERDPDLPRLLGKEQFLEWVTEVERAIPALKT